MSGSQFVDICFATSCDWNDICNDKECVYSGGKSASIVRWHILKHDLKRNNSEESILDCYVQVGVYSRNCIKHKCKSKKYKKLFKTSLYK